MTGREATPRSKASDAKTLHASCVAVDGQGVLILGKSGQGKSCLALQLMAFGAELISDDRTLVWREDATLMAGAPDRLRGLIEAREVGILRVKPADAHPVTLGIDMETPENARLPEHHETSILGCIIPVLRKSDLPHFPAAIMTYLRGQREA